MRLSCGSHVSSGDWISPVLTVILRANITSKKLFVCDSVRSEAAVNVVCKAQSTNQQVSFQRPGADLFLVLCQLKYQTSGQIRCR